MPRHATSLSGKRVLLTSFSDRQKPDDSHSTQCIQQHRFGKCYYHANIEQDKTTYLQAKMLPVMENNVDNPHFNPSSFSSTQNTLSLCTWNNPLYGTCQIVLSTISHICNMSLLKSVISCQNWGVDGLKCGGSMPRTICTLFVLIGAGTLWNTQDLHVLPPWQSRCLTYSGRVCIWDTHCQSHDRALYIWANTPVEFAWPAHRRSHRCWTHCQAPPMTAGELLWEPLLATTRGAPTNQGLPWWMQQSRLASRWAWYPEAQTRDLLAGRSAAVVHYRDPANRTGRHLVMPWTPQLRASPQRESQRQESTHPYPAGPRGNHSSAWHHPWLTIGSNGSQCQE